MFESLCVHDCEGLRLCFQQFRDILVGIKNSQCKGRARETTWEEQSGHKSRSEVCQCWTSKGTYSSWWIYSSRCTGQNSVWASSHKIMLSCASFCRKSRQWSWYGLHPSKAIYICIFSFLAFLLHHIHFL